jgi:hypothetical protein
MALYCSSLTLLTSSKLGVDSSDASVPTGKTTLTRHSVYSECPSDTGTFRVWQQVQRKKSVGTSDALHLDLARK